MIINLENISKKFTDKMLLDDINLPIKSTDKIGLIGVNGSGKTTLLKIILGLEDTDVVNNVHGNVWIKPGIQIAYLKQTPELNDELTILEQVKVLNEHVEEYEIKTMLNKLGINDFDQKIANLSGGEKRRVDLTATLLTNSDFLILDEPTNHLDNDMVNWLESFLSTTKKPFIMITHDRYFLDKVVNKIIEIDEAKIYSYEGNYSKFLELKELRGEMEAATLRKKKSLYRTELAWMKQGPRARGTKSVERKERFEKLAKEVKVESKDKLKITSNGSRIGTKTFELNNVTKTFDDKTVINDFTYTGLRYDRIGIIGKNGAGKSTLLNVIAQKIAPTSGTAVLGETIKLAYFDQHLTTMPENEKVIDYIKNIAEYFTNEGKEISASKMLEIFLFKPSVQHSVIEKLSGGEKRRLQLLALLATAPNFLIFDEPTNDLDIETLTILEDYLDNFQGVIVTVSHDRYFLDKVVDRIFEVGENGNITIHNGGYTDYFEQIGNVRKPVETSKPKQNNSKKDAKLMRAQIRAIEKEIETLEAQNVSLNESVYLPEIYEDPIKLAKINEEITNNASKLEQLYEQYMELES